MLLHGLFCLFSSMIKSFAKTGVVIAFILGSQASTAQLITGKWVTIDDETNEPKSVVEIFEKEGQFFGKITKLFRKPGEDPDPVCEECPADDERYKKKVLGMEIIRNMIPDEDEYSGGSILDPKVGPSIVAGYGLRTTISKYGVTGDLFTVLRHGTDLHSAV